MSNRFEIDEEFNLDFDVASLSQVDVDKEEKDFIDSVMLELNKRTSYEAVAKILTGITLDNRQQVDLLKMLCMKQMLLCYETGLGKTLMACAWIKMLRRKVAKKFIFFIKNNQVLQTPDKIRECTGLKVLCSTGDIKDYKSIFRTQEFLDCDILLLTHSTLLDYKFMGDLFAHRDSFTGVIVDEVHGLCGYTDSIAGFMLKNLLSYYDYRLGLTATPITTNIEQLSKLIVMFLPEHFTNYKKVNTLVNSVYNKTLNCAGKEAWKIVQNHHIVRERKNEDRAFAVYIEPCEEQLNDKNIVFSISTKGYGAYNSLLKLQEVMYPYHKRKQKGLVYVNIREIFDFLQTELSKSFYKFTIINGATPLSERKQILEDFANGKYDVVLTNITESLDLTCDYIIFYEQTHLHKQMIGRGKRGLNPKPIDIIYLIVRDTKEYDFFMNNIYDISMKAEKILNQSYKEIKSIKRQLDSDYGG